MQQATNGKLYNGKEAFILNVSDSMNARIIQNAREKIAQLEISQESLRPSYEENQKFYLEAKVIYDDIATQMNNLIEEEKQQQIIIQTFVNFKKVDRANKRLQTYSEPEQHNGTKAPKYMKWIDEAAIVLREQNRFMFPGEVYDLIVLKPEIMALMKHMKSFNTNPSGVKFTTITSFIEHALRYTDDNIRGKRYNARLTVYNERVGLCEWVDQDNRPKLQYLKEFMSDHVQEITEIEIANS